MIQVSSFMVAEKYPYGVTQQEVDEPHSAGLSPQMFRCFKL